jgi:hypothetical protein
MSYVGSFSAQNGQKLPTFAAAYKDHSVKAGVRTPPTSGASRYKGCANLRTPVSKRWEMCEIMLNRQVPEARTRTLPQGEATTELRFGGCFTGLSALAICRIRGKPVARVSAGQVKRCSASLYKLR